MKKIAMLCAWMVVTVNASAFAGQTDLVAPCRLYDSRNIGGPNAGAKISTATIETKNAALDATSFTYGGVNYNNQGGQTGCKAPVDAVGAVVNVTVINQTGSGIAKLWAAGTTEPLVSAVSFASSPTIEPTGTTVTIGNDGQIYASLPYSTAHIVLDVTAWIVDGATTGISGTVFDVYSGGPTLKEIVLTSGSRIWCMPPRLPITACDRAIGSHVAAIGTPVLASSEVAVIATEIQP